MINFSINDPDMNYHNTIVLTPKALREEMDSPFMQSRISSTIREWFMNCPKDIAERISQDVMMDERMWEVVMSTIALTIIDNYEHETQTI